MNKKKLAGTIFGVVVLVIAAMATPAIAANSGAGIITLSALLHGSFSTAKAYMAAQYEVQNGIFVLGPQTRFHFGISTGTGSHAWWYTTDSYTAPTEMVGHGTWHLDTLTHYGLTKTSYDGSSELEVYIVASGNPTSKNIASQEKSGLNPDVALQFKFNIYGFVDTWGGTSTNFDFIKNIGVSFEIPIEVDG